MRDLNLLKLLAAIGTVALVNGCATTSTPRTDLQVQSPRKIKLHTADSLRNAWDQGKAFAVIGQVNNGASWEMISLTTKPPRVATGQEVFLVSDDLKAWESTIPRFQDCSKARPAYSVCSSSLAQKDWLGYANYSAEEVVRAVNSIPDDQATAMMNQYLKAEDSAALAKYQEKKSEQAACYANHEAESREVELTGGKAMASAIAGKQLKPEEMAAIRRAQQRMPASSVCGYNIQPPKKRVSAGG